MITPNWRQASLRIRRTGPSIGLIEINYQMLKIEMLTPSDIEVTKITFSRRGALEHGNRMLDSDRLPRITARNRGIAPGTPNEPRREPDKNNKAQRRAGLCGRNIVNGGGGGIRTHGWSPIAGFQDRCNRPLCHPSARRASYGLGQGL